MDVAATVGVVWKQESARIVAGLLRLVHDVGLAEEMAQEALVAALEQWPATGVPDNPAAWLTTIAKRRAVDHLRRSQRLTQAVAEPVQADEQERDDVLRLMFISCHPVLPTRQRVALTLRVVAGLSTAEIARAFLVTEPEIVRRIAAAKRALAGSGAAYELPTGDELRERLSSVLEVVYAVFNEGYSASSGDDLMRPDLCLEALRLGRLLAGLAPDEAEVHGLVALMEVQQSRSAARTGPSGEPIPLHEQNRGLWDRLLIERGFAAMLRARAAGGRPGGRPGVYVLQAAIAVCHAQARTAEDTDWVQIATLYEALVRLLPTPVVQLNRAVARGFAEGPAAGLEVLDTLRADPSMRDYHLLPGVRGDLLQRLGRLDEARFEFERAASLAPTGPERDFLRRRASSFDDGPALGAAISEFLSGLSPATARAYGQTLQRVRRSLGDRTPLSVVTADRVTAVFDTTWAHTSARTWNRHRAAVRSFAGWAGLPDTGRDLVAGIERRVEEPAERPEVSADTDGPLRERVLWSLLRESGAPVGAVLALNVEDLDLDDRRARAGDRWIGWRSGTAALLPGLLAGRARGPLFLSDRRPGPA
ncbi:sigma-70 family RNA polymerase sigma factor, partial [Actinoplanes sp. NPDC051633]|uniref:sigma-70 family RNA polymerase sigma factor n=1 Tax=Actinoplanes sp. NPDC051633 TaxID=3155670 RepID=UPI00344124F8